MLSFSGEQATQGEFCEFSAFSHLYALGEIDRSLLDVGQVSEGPTHQKDTTISYHTDLSLHLCILDYFIQRQSRARNCHAREKLNVWCYLGHHEPVYNEISSRQEWRGRGHGIL